MGDLVMYKGAAYASNHYRVTKVAPGGHRVWAVNVGIGTSHEMRTDVLRKV